jgi:4-amino-4-deoxy-L-arabinose transferase-like glycosyltransferase
MSPYSKHAAQQKRSNEQYLFFMAVVFFITNSLSQYALSSTANLDQAEQLVFSQDWHLGYSSQPPLFTWLVHSLFFVTGPSLLALIGIKVFLLSTLVGLLILMGKQLGFTPQQQLVSLIGMVFIPQYVWESQRDITHSLLATVIAAATLLQLIRIRSYIPKRKHVLYWAKTDGIEFQ